MKRLIPAVVAAAALSGCVTTYRNPLTPTTLATVESVYGSALATAVSYKRLCIAKVYSVVGTDCRKVVARMQAADAQAYAQIKIARDFVKQNPTVDASVVISAAYQSASAFIAVANATGVK